MIMGINLFSDLEFKQICDIMYEAAGLSYNDSKKSLIQSRLAPRIQKLGLAGFADYIAILEDESEAAEFQMAVDLLTTNETYFFREPKHYDLLEKELSARKSRAPLAIWSAASSFGDEAYSTAMLLSDLQTSGRIGPDWSILATDISHRVLLSAKEAVYPQDRLRAVSPERLKRYCLKGEGPAQGQSMMQDKLRQRGVLVYGGGEDDVIFETKSCAVSIHAHREGKNLQHYSKALFLAVPASGQWWEQACGRIHRQGQLADEVEISVLLPCMEMWEAFAQARRDSVYVYQTKGSQQMLQFADIDVSSEEEVAKRAVKWPRDPLWCTDWSRTQPKVENVGDA